MGIVSSGVILDQLRILEKDLLVLDNKLVYSFDQAECELIERSQKEVNDLEEKWAKIEKTTKDLQKTNGRNNWTMNKSLDVEAPVHV